MDKSYIDIRYDETLEGYDVKKIRDDCIILNTGDVRLIDTPEEYIEFLHNDLIANKYINENEITCIRAGELFKIIPGDPLRDDEVMSGMEECFEFIDKH